MRFCENKICPNPVFGTDRITGKGYCKSHQYLRTDLDKRSIIQKAMSKEKSKRIASKLRQLPENIEGVEKKKTQNEWYAIQKPKMVGRCCNCNGFTQNKDSSFYKWSIAHVLPKNIFKSVSMNDSNWIELCISCHTLFDRNLATASEMKCFKKAVMQYQKFKDEVTETHKYKALFEEYANQL